jgi:hypothetical protein
MLFGKIKNTENEWGFDLTSDLFESFVSVDDSIHMNIIDRANSEGKIIKGDKDGNPILVDPPPLTEEDLKQERIIELENYLNQTDWYAIRFADWGVEIPLEIKQKRQSAREEISMLRDRTV